MVSNDSRNKMYLSSARRFRVRGKGAESIPTSKDRARLLLADTENPFQIHQVIKKLYSSNITYVPT